MQTLGSSLPGTIRSTLISEYMGSLSFSFAKLEKAGAGARNGKTI